MKANFLRHPVIQVVVAIIIFGVISLKLEHNSGNANTSVDDTDFLANFDFGELSVLFGPENQQNSVAFKEFSKAVEIIASRDYESLAVAMGKGKHGIKSKFAYCRWLIPMVNEAADYYRIPRSIALALIAKESACDASVPPSSVGAIGLTQIYWVPKEAHESAARALGIDVNRLNYRTKAKHNIYLGMATLNEYRNQLGGSLIAAIGAYYAGTMCYRSLFKNDVKEVFAIGSLKERFTDLSDSECKVGQKMQVEYTWDVFAYATVYEREVLGNQNAGIPFLDEYFSK